MNPTTPDLTRTCQPFTSAELLSALETAWTTIRTRHPEVPEVVLIVGSGSPTKPNAALKYGHFASLRWQHGDRQLPEVLISGEGLKRTPAEVLVTLLHEATHGLADVRGVQDTSRQGRWHNKKFATLAAELGLTAVKDDKLGYSPCTLTDQAAADYGDVITGLSRVLHVYRHPEVFGPRKERASSNNGVSCECECPRKIRLSLEAFDKGAIVCGTCEAAFLPEDIDRDTYAFPSFGQPCTHGDTPADQTPATDLEDPMRFYDPTGDRHGGTPTYPFRMAPTGLATRRQLAEQGLRPGGQEIAAQILWRRGDRVAYLYRIDLAKPKRPATPAQLAALGKALAARRTCPKCGDLKTHYISTRHGMCADCQGGA